MIFTSFQLPVSKFNLIRVTFIGRSFLSGLRTFSAWTGIEISFLSISMLPNEWWENLSFFVYFFQLVTGSAKMERRLLCLGAILGKRAKISLRGRGGCEDWGRVLLPLLLFTSGSSSSSSSSFLSSSFCLFLFSFTFTLGAVNSCNYSPTTLKPTNHISSNQPGRDLSGLVSSSSSPPPLVVVVVCWKRRRCLEQEEMGERELASSSPPPPPQKMKMRKRG